MINSKTKIKTGKYAGKEIIWIKYNEPQYLIGLLSDTDVPQEKKEELLEYLSYKDDILDAYFVLDNYGDTNGDLLLFEKEFNSKELWKLI